jgi:hypothetical protein
MHGKYNVKFSVAQQAKSVYNYLRLKEKLHKTNASIWFNKICRMEQLTPNISGSPSTAIHNVAKIQRKQPSTPT